MLLEDSLIRCKQYILILRKSDLFQTSKRVKEYYDPHRVLGKYFKVHCVDGTVYHFPESEFSKFEKYIIKE
jgi:hypothetical protein